MDNQVFGHIFVFEIVVIILAVNAVAFSDSKCRWKANLFSTESM